MKVWVLGICLLRRMLAPQLLLPETAKDGELFFLPGHDACEYSNQQTIRTAGSIKPLCFYCQ